MFVFFSMVCGMALDLPSMIVARAAQGFTGGVLIPMSFSIILQTLPPSKQAIGLAIFAITATFAPSIGPAVGGFITDTFGWRNIFFVNLVPGILFILLLFYALPSKKPERDLLKRADIFGILTMAAGLSCLIFILEEGQRKDWFGSEQIQHAAWVSAICIPLFIIREVTARYPLVNLRLFLRRNFCIGTFINVGVGLALYGVVYLMPMYLSTTQGYSAWQIGKVMIWSGLPQLLIIPLIPSLMNKIDARLLTAIGLVFFGLSCAMNAFMSHDYAGEQLMMSMLVRAIGQPLILTPLSALATHGIEVEQAGSASAMFNMMRNLGGSIGTALCSTIVTQREQFHSERIGEHISYSEPMVREWLTQAAHTLQHAGATSWTSYQQSLQLLSEKIRLEANVMAFNDAFAFIALVMLFGLLQCIFLKKPEGQLHAAAE
jgi:DHA2 family multidrug resistance protein